MGLIGTTTEQSYYSQSKSWTGDGTGGSGTLSFNVASTDFPTRPTQQGNIVVFINGIEIAKSNYSYNGTSPGDTTADSSYNLLFTSSGINSDVQETNGAPKSGLVITLKENTSTEGYGGYQHISLDDIISNFIIAYVGNEKIINRVRKADVAFHAQRALQEFSYDTFKSKKSFEVEVSTTLILPLPQDYVNYTKISFVERTTGIKRVLYPVRNTSNPRSILQDDSYDFLYDSSTGDLLESNDSNAWTRYKTSNEIDVDTTSDEDLEKKSEYLLGGRYGLTPETAQFNGSFYIDELRGNIHFSSNLSGKTIVIDYISDSLGTDAEMVVHKFAEEAMYKYLAHAILATKSNIPEYLVNRFKKESFAAKRVAKLRLSNLKSEELTQTMRNKSKIIKH
tara:strand:- start:9951 stop:11132 length:1182 start_codon:yes stop_codon:yes gene_type:complete